ncbi:MAG: hypothetical protein mread185_000374 [Mycoplasmataceae bacterium]|nr:MAG: hypothetical protein mread185_000374 [Mycoplasmataceae bacterium]
MKYLCIDPSGTGTTGVFFFKISKEIEWKFSDFKSANWEEHLKFIINISREWEPDMIIYENATYIYGRQHQGTVGLYKLIGGIVSLKHFLNFVQGINSVAVNQVKSFKNKLFKEQEQIEDLTYQKGRGGGWKYKLQKINLHQLDALVIYHLWSEKGLESKKSIKKKIVDLKAKKRLGPKQTEQLNKLESFLKNNKISQGNSD